MQPFDYQKISTIKQAVSPRSDQARFIAGGTMLLDLMKLDVETPHLVVDVNALPLSQIEALPDGGLRIGAMVRNADLAHHDVVMKRFTVLSEALLSGASPQLRNKATTSGNLLQRTRCVYFRDSSKACNKRQPGSGCSAIDGFNRNLAILGASASCIATNPSDMNVALTALEGTVHIESAAGKRDVAMADFHLLPGTTPHLETALKPGELITGVSLAPLPASTRSHYFKIRDRASYEFALASAAVVVSQKDGRFERVRIAMGGIGTKPWRSLDAEKVLVGGPLTDDRLKAAADALLKDAHPQSQNAFKIELAKRCLVHALKQVAST